MILYPAIDLKDGQCVRLLRGEMEAATVFNDDPTAQALSFVEQGAEWLHVVDLNGAFKGRPVNLQAVGDILKSVSIPIQLGGGIRNMDAIDTWLSAGISRIILGTAALTNPQLIREACAAYPGKIVVGLDGRGGKVAVEGWAKQSEISILEMAEMYEDAGVAAIIYTDVGRDGAMEGPDVQGTLALCQAVTVPIIASGGVASMNDLLAMKQLEPVGLSGVIVGRALYDGAINLSDAVGKLKA